MWVPYRKDGIWVHGLSEELNVGPLWHVGRTLHLINQ